MKNTFKLVTILSLILQTSFAQFGPPGGGGGMGGRGGDQDLKGRNSNQPGMPGQTQEVVIEKGPNRITGFIKDSISNKAVEFANLALYKKSDLKKPVEGGMTDDFGKFTIKGLPDGDYVLKISFIGYEDKTIEVPTLSKGKREFAIKDLILAPSTKLLSEVTVTGQKSLLEDKVDRLVYNADIDKTSAGGNASDVLRKVPMLSVDLEGNLSMRGSQNVRVLINNKPALKQIPAEMIKTVEVITSPSAKYDGEGTAGIVNIITKKNNLQGLTGIINASGGTVGSNLFGNFNYKKGKLGTSLSGGGNMFYNKSASSTIINSNRNNVNILTNQNTTGRDNGLFGNAQFAADYELTKKSSLTSSVRYGQRGFNSAGLINSSTKREGVETSSFKRDIESNNKNQNVDVNLDYTKTFEKAQKEFSILSQYSNSFGNNGFEAALKTNSNELINRQLNDNMNHTQEGTMQIDFQNPIGKNQQLEIGGKGILRNISNDFKYYIGDLSRNFKIDPRYPSNQFSLNQNIAASYLSYTVSTTNKYTFKLGSRYEYTGNDGQFADNTKLNIKDYGNFIPSLQISKKVSGSTTLKSSYNRRIQRPSMRNLSPNIDYSNPQSISTGNPELLPELTDAFEFAISTFKKANSLNLSLFHRITTDAITQVRTVLDNGVISSRQENIGLEKSFGVNIFGSTRITQKWQLNLGSNAYYAMLSNPTTKQTNSGWVVDGNYFLMGQLSKGWALQSFGFIRGPRVQLQGKQAGYFMTNFGAKKDFTLKNGNKGSFGLAVDNPFTNGVKLKSSFTDLNFNQENINTRFNRGVRATLSYQFGKMTFGKTKKSINNDDTKQEDSGNQGGGAGGGGRRGN
jgi:outer membrane receptor protein involved in Fe transport